MADTSGTLFSLSETQADSPTNVVNVSSVGAYADLLQAAYNNSDSRYNLAAASISLGGSPKYMRFNVSVQGRFPVWLKDSNGARVTGAVATDFLNSRIYFRYSDGTYTFVTLVLNTNLFEVDSTNLKGLYEVLFTPTVRGAICWQADPSGTKFLAAEWAGEVGYAPVDESTLATQSTATAIKSKTDNLPASPAATGDVTSAVTSINSHTDSATSPLATQVTATAIKSKTDLIPASPASSGDVSGVATSINSHTDSAVAGLASQSMLDAVKSKTDNLPSDPADASDVAAAISSAVSGLAQQSTVSEIKMKTDSLPSDPADASDVASAISAAVAPLATQSTALAIKAKTDLIPAGGIASSSDVTAAADGIKGTNDLDISELATMLDVVYHMSGYDSGRGVRVTWTSNNAPNNSPSPEETYPSYTGTLSDIRVELRR